MLAWDYLGEVLKLVQTRIICFRPWEKEVSEGGLGEGAEMAKRMTLAALLREILFHLDETRSVSEVDFENTFNRSYKLISQPPWYLYRSVLVTYKPLTALFKPEFPCIYVPVFLHVPFHKYPTYIHHINFEHPF